MRITSLLLLVLFYGPRLAQGQPLRASTYESLVEVAEEAMEAQDYYNALDLYEQAYEKRNEEEIVPVIADLHFKLRDYRRAVRWYERLYRLDDNGNYDAYRLRYGRLLKMNGNYPQAIEVLEEFIRDTPAGPEKNLAENELIGAQLALDLPGNPKGATLEQADRRINTSFSEYSPIMTRNGEALYYSGFDTNEIVYVDDDSPENYARIFVARKDEDRWERPDALGTEINRPGFHVGNVALTEDNNTMYFTRMQLQGNVPNYSKIYYSVGGDGNWGPAEEVAGVNGDYLAKHPAPGELFGRQVLFFVSDMEGGFGGFDIYYAPRTGEGVFGMPVNLGPLINTPGDEETPFYRDGRLYFSSTGLPGMGGFDIFSSDWDGQRWSDPVNLGKAFNTSVDERFFSLDAEGYHGAMTSNREEGRSVHGQTCCDDIYLFEIPRLYADLVVGVFTENRRELFGATVTLIPMQNNRPGIAERQTKEEGNRYDFGLELDMPYMIIAEREGFYPDTLTLTTEGITESETFERRFYLSPTPQVEEPLYDTLSIEEPIVLENINYDLDSDRIRPEAEPDLELVYELMTEHDSMVIELRSHTDYRGDDPYNLDLSQRRSESARRWLMRRGLARARMEARGYGETVPYTVKPRDAAAHPFLQAGDVLTPSYIDSLPNTEQQEVAHELNRRTEFQIIQGPTTIVIERQRLRRRENQPRQQPDRRSQIGDDTLRVHRLSSLYGKGVLSGVPIMQFEEREVDFGAVRQGEKRSHTYSFVNRGDTPLKIALVSACECTHVEYSTARVDPGESGSLTVTFDSKDKEEAETISLDIFLENKMPGTEEPIIETLEYSFTILP